MGDGIGHFMQGFGTGAQQGQQLMMIQKQQEREKKIFDQQQKLNKLLFEEKQAQMALNKSQREANENVITKYLQSQVADTPKQQQREAWAAGTGTPAAEAGAPMGIPYGPMSQQDMTKELFSPTSRKTPDEQLGIAEFVAQKRAGEKSDVKSEAAMAQERQLLEWKQKYSTKEPKRIISSAEMANLPTPDGDEVPFLVTRDQNGNIMSYKSMQRGGMSVAEAASAGNAILGNRATLYQFPKRGNARGRIMKAVEAVNPKFNYQYQDANYRWIMSGTGSRVINALKATMPRVEALHEQVKTLPNVKLRPWNAAKRAYLTTTGDPRYSAFEANRTQVAQEVGQAITGSSQGSDFRIQTEIDILTSAASPAQLDKAVKQLHAALVARLDAAYEGLYPWEVITGEVSLKDWQKAITTLGRATADQTLQNKDDFTIRRVR